MQQPILVEIIAFAPTAFYQCTHCEVAFREMGRSDQVHREQLASSLPEDLMQEYRALSDWVRDMFRLHCDRIEIKMIDAASMEGVFRSLRCRTRRFPVVIVDERGCFTGSDALARAADDIGRRINAPALAPSIV